MNFFDNISLFFKETILTTPLYKALFYILLSMIIAKISDIIFTLILRRMAGKTENSVDDKIIDTLHKPIYYTILFIGLGLSTSFIESLNSVQFIINGCLKTLIVIIWGSAIFKSFIYIVKWYSSRSGVKKHHQKRLIPLFDNLGKIVIFIAAVYFIFIGWGVNVTGWLASAGILGVVLGFAAKDTLANLFAGIFIMADAPYKENDYINLDTGERGYVKNIGIRSTRIMTRDDIEITIPNSVIANSKIINESGGPHEQERVRVNVSVAYGSDIKKVREILTSIATNADEVCSDPAPRVRFRQFGDSALMFQLLFWIEKPEMRGRVVDSINSIIYDRFNADGIEIPFPQRTLHIKKSIDE